MIIAEVGVSQLNFNLQKQIRLQLAAMNKIYTHFL